MRFFYFLFLFVNFSVSLSWAQTEYANFSEKHVTPFFEKAWDQKSQFILAAGAASVFIVNPQDDFIRTDWKNHHQMSKDFSHTGDLMGSGIVGAMTIGVQYFYDGESDHWISHARGLVWGTVFSSALKVTFGRPRPGNSDSHHSFPSGHTTAAFATATSLSYAYGWKAAAVVYPLAVFVGLSRLADDAHWASDVVGGAFLGFWAARASFYSTKQIEEDKQKYVLLPVVDPDQLGVSLVYSY